MDSKINDYVIKDLEKNFGLTPADCLILEIQKPKMPVTMKCQIDSFNKKRSTRHSKPIANPKYKDPKVS